MKKPQTQDEFIRKRIERRKRIKKRRLKLFFIFFIILFFCVFVTLSLTVLFPIGYIKVSGNNIYSVDQIISHSGIDVGDNLFAISKSAVLQKLRTKLPYVEGVELERTLPDTLNIKIKEASEYICYSERGEYFFISKSGWVLKKSGQAPKNFMVVKGAKVKCSVGEEIEFSDTETQELINRIILSAHDNSVVINELDVSDKISLNFIAEGRFNVELGTPNFIEEKIRHLSTMIENIPDKSKGKINLNMWSESNPEGTFSEEIAK